MYKNVLWGTLLVHASVVLLSPFPFGTVGRTSYFAGLEGVVLNQKFMPPLSITDSMKNLMGECLVEEDVEVCLLPAYQKANHTEHKGYKVSQVHHKGCLFAPMSNLVGLRYFKTCFIKQP